MFTKQACPAGQEEAGSNRPQGGYPWWGLGAGKEEVKIQEISHTIGLYQREAALKSFQPQGWAWKNQLVILTLQGVWELGRELRQSYPTDGGHDLAAFNMKLFTD